MSPTRESGVLTVAAIRRPKGRRGTEYLFHERQQIFTLRSTTASAATSAKRLEEAFRQKTPVEAVLDTRRALIQKIATPSARELAEFHRLRTLLDGPDRSVRVDVSSIDPTTFNIVDHYLRFRCFQPCTRIVPNYKTAKKIFDFCAKQSCHLPGPYDISPCIPFQYVRDGCYARAHKMRWIITTKYRYCCEKVFSFANPPQNEPHVELAVRADKWGGCCVTWWYHVAPLVRVRFSVPVIRAKVVLALVIDPSMFDKPVLLSTWLAAQENKGCASDAKVRMYSIQPGAAYWPASYDGTMFATDPSYTSTDATLTNYHSLTTCP